MLVRDKDAGSVRSRRLRARPRTPDRALQRVQAARRSFCGGLLLRPPAGSCAARRENRPRAELPDGVGELVRVGELDAQANAVELAQLPASLDAVREVPIVVAVRR